MAIIFIKPFSFSLFLVVHSVSELLPRYYFYIFAFAASKCAAGNSELLIFFLTSKLFTNKNPF